MLFGVVLLDNMSENVVNAELAAELWETSERVTAKALEK